MPIYIHDGLGTEKFESSGVYTCMECGRVVRFARGETIPPCPRCYNDTVWQLIRKIWE